MCNLKKRPFYFLGKRPLLFWCAALCNYKELKIQIYFAFVGCRWCNIRPLPGANRLIKHLRSNGVPMALASNSPKSNIETKISCHDGNNFPIDKLVTELWTIDLSLYLCYPYTDFFNNSIQTIILNAWHRFWKMCKFTVF